MWALGALGRGEKSPEVLALAAPTALQCSPPPAPPPPPINQPEAPRAMVWCGARVVVWERAGYLCSWWVEGKEAVSRAGPVLRGRVKTHCLGSH